MNYHNFIVAVKKIENLNIVARSERINICLLQIPCNYKIKNVFMPFYFFQFQTSLFIQIINFGKLGRVISCAKKKKMVVIVFFVLILFEIFPASCA